jgi:hypothetical protein
MKQRPLITMFLVFIKFSGWNGADGSEILEEFWAWLAFGGLPRVSKFNFQFSHFIGIICFMFFRFIRDL